MTRAAAVAVTALLLVASGCGSSEPASDPGTTVSPSPTASRSATPTPATSNSPTDTPTSQRGRLAMVAADQATVPTSGCRAHPRQGLVCAKQRGYRFPPGKVRVVEVVAVVADQDAGGSWVVNLSLDRAGSAVLAGISRVAVQSRQILLLMVPGSRRVISAPQVVSPVLDGNVQVSVGADGAAARRIVTLITHSAG